MDHETDGDLKRKEAEQFTLGFVKPFGGGIAGLIIGSIVGGSDGALVGGAIGSFAGFLIVLVFSKES